MSCLTGLSDSLSQEYRRGTWD